METPSPKDKFKISGNNVMKRFFNKPEPAFYLAQDIYATYFSHNPEIEIAEWEQVTEYFSEMGANITPYSDEN